MSDARLLAEWFPEFAEHLDKMDETYKEMRTIDEKTYQFITAGMRKSVSRVEEAKQTTGSGSRLGVALATSLRIGREVRENLHMQGD